MEPRRGRLHMADQHYSKSIDATRHWDPRIATLDGAASETCQASSRLLGGMRCGAGLEPPETHPRICDAFFSAVECFGKRPALVTRQRSFSFAELGHRAICVAHDLLADDRYRPGDRVAVMLDNGPEFIAAYYGILVAGGVVVPLPANIEWSRLARIAQICQVQKILTTCQTARRRMEIQEHHCTPIDFGQSHTLDVAHISPLLVRNQTLAMVMFTSGSSGDPKGVMLSDANLLANTASILKYLPITRDDRALVLLPFYHAFGHSILQTHLLTGATLVVDGNMAFPCSVLDALERHRSTSFSAVPEGYYSLLGMSDLRDRKLPDLRYMSVAGGALKPAAVVEVARSIAPAEFYVMYGQTEASARLSYLPAHLAQIHPNSIGIGIPGVELRSLTRDGHEAEVGETGELCARGANVMLGYWNDSSGTAQVLQDGWLRTGDLASRDENGLFYVEARKNDLVKIQGFRIHPREVEDVVSQHFPQLRIIVVPYDRRGTTRLAMFAITNQENATIVSELRRVSARELPRHKIPSFFKLLPEAPLNASMKLDRTALKRHAELATQSADNHSPKRLSA